MEKFDLENGDTNGNGLGHNLSPTSTEKLESFSYDQLDMSVDCIRILVLLPNRRGPSPWDTPAEADAISCEMVHRTFVSKPKYEAVSYTWGEEEPTMLIEVNGCQFRVRKNLYNALSLLRHKSEKRALWVDAICINQEDIAERNSQVSIMAFIFTRAQRVLVWLGIPAQPMGESDPLQNFMTSEQNRLAICNHRYWSRVWIIQEVGLANELRFCFGSFTYTWKELKRSLSSPIYVETGDRLERIVKQPEVRHTRQHRLELLLENFQDASCSEPRDKIFGFLGLAQDCLDDSLTVNYDISMLDLYVSVIDFHQDAIPFDDMDNISRAVDRSARLMKFSQLVQRVFEGAVDREARINKSFKRTRTHTARCYVAGKILHIGPTYSYFVSSYNATKEWKRSFDVHYAGSSALESLRKFDDSYSQLVLEWDQPHLKRISTIDTVSGFGFRWKAEASANIGINENDAEEVIGTEPRRFLGTHSLIGFVPPQAKVGDTICTFFGCDITVVLRQQGDQDYFRIIGSADISTEKDRKYDLMNAINFNSGKRDNYREISEELYFEDMMNLKVDIETLQKLTS